MTNSLSPAKISKSVVLPVMVASFDIHEEVSATAVDRMTVIFRRFSRFDPIDNLLKFDNTAGSSSAYMNILGGFDSEIEILYPQSTDQRIQLGLATIMLSLISVKSGANLHCPAFSNRSFADTQNYRNDSIILKDFEMAAPQRITSNLTINKSDALWACKNIEHLNSLKKLPRFKSAWESYHAAQRQIYPSTSVLVSWSGIEAIFNVESELKFRLSVLIANYLETEIENRMALFKRAKNSYDARSRIVHGSSKGESNDEQFAAEASEWLRNCLLRCVSEGALPNEESLLIGLADQKSVGKSD